jgi:hypothetical protein
MISHLKLPLGVDPQLLRQDLDQVNREDWIRHFNTRYFEGQWTGAVLRAAAGFSNTLYSDPHATESFAATKLLERCPNIADFLKRFQCPLRSVRLLRLEAGSVIREHRDFDLGLADGVVRVHMPLRTNPDVVFFLDAHRLEMSEGECWYLDLSLPHWVENRGVSDRIHLVIDCEVNQWLVDLLSAAESGQAARVAGPTGPCSAEALEQFLLTALSDQILQERLRVTADNESFARLAVELGQGSGYFFNVSHVETALQKALQQWRQQATSY